MNNGHFELDSIINEVRSELRTILVKRRKLIERVGFAFEKVVLNKESICEEIKNCLKEEIALGITSARTIEHSCRPEWKKKTRPKLENENFSFSPRKSEEEREQVKIIMDNLGNPVRDTSANDIRKDGKGTTQHDSDLLQRLSSIIKELIYENKKIIQEKDEIRCRLGEALESLHAQKQREGEQYPNVFDTEFSVDYRQLQKYMAQIYKSTVRQEVWVTVKIDTNKRKVVSAHVGRMLLQQNTVETGK